jgi:hypothetical protein
LWDHRTVSIKVVIHATAFSSLSPFECLPREEPVGPYTLVERQEGEDFFKYYSFYEGRDSVGSNGYNMYVSMQSALDMDILNVSYESDELDVYGTWQRRHRRTRHLDEAEGNGIAQTNSAEPFVYMRSGPTPSGPRNSIRLEGNRRFNRGLFIIDLRHMPAGKRTL